METLSEAGRITISESTYELIKDDFICSERGEFEVKGFGMTKLYFLEREVPSLRKKWGASATLTIIPGDDTMPPS
jgi:class 3 adenylate cyclase